MAHISKLGLVIYVALFTLLLTTGSVDAHGGDGGGERGGNRNLTRPHGRGEKPDRHPSFNATEKEFNKFNRTRHGLRHNGTFPVGNRNHTRPLFDGDERNSSEHRQGKGEGHGGARPDIKGGLSSHEPSPVNKSQKNEEANRERDSRKPNGGNNVSPSRSDEVPNRDDKKKNPATGNDDKGDSTTTAGNAKLGRHLAAAARQDPVRPNNNGTRRPTKVPVPRPTQSPRTKRPTRAPVPRPTRAPRSKRPTKAPVPRPTKSPVTKRPTNEMVPRPENSKRPTKAPVARPAQSSVPKRPTKKTVARSTQSPDGKRPTEEIASRSSEAAKQSIESRTLDDDEVDGNGYYYDEALENDAYT